MNATKWCMDDKHGTPCKLPCEACVADECDPVFSATYDEMDQSEKDWMAREVKMGNIPAEAIAPLAAALPASLGLLLVLAAFFFA